jgi:hypothetical protein
MARQGGSNGGGGAGAGAGAGGDGSGGDGGGGDGDIFTPQQNEHLSRIVNSAVTSILGRKLGPAIKESLGSELGDIRETLTKMAGGQQQQQQPGSAGGAGGGTGGAGAQPDPKVRDLERQLAEMRAERENDQRRVRESSRDVRLRELAVAAKVDPNRVRGVVALLKDQVKFADDGRPVMTLQRNGYTEDVELDHGVGEFFKSDEGKAYLAPTNGGRPAMAPSTSGRQGGAAAPGGAGPRNAPAMSREQAKEARKQAAFEKLKQGVEQLVGGGNIDIG